MKEITDQEMRKAIKTLREGNVEMSDPHIIVYCPLHKKPHFFGEKTPKGCWKSLMMENK